MPSRYPKATWKGDGKSAGAYTSGPFKVVLHTTETAGVPSYNSGGSAPHLTYYAAKRQWIQHTDLMVSARALRNEDGGVQTNRDSALQVEIVAYSNEPIVDQYPNTGRVKVSQLTPENLADLREFIDWAGVEFGVALKWPGKKALSYGQANASGFRMTAAEWDRYDGVCAHQHVPENLHWDTGNLDWATLMEEEMAEIAPPSKYAAPSWEAVTQAGIFTTSSDPHEAMSKQDFAVFLMRLGVIDKQADGTFVVDLDLKGALDNAVKTMTSGGTVDQTARTAAATAQTTADAAKAAAAAAQTTANAQKSRLDKAKAAL